ncbi:MAG TPA: glutamate-1-semialdehyde 2,1-aminomutase [Gaiellaceae bacterium]
MVSVRSTQRSAELFERAQRTLVDGVSSPSRGPLNYHPGPIYIAGGKAGHMTDVDGNDYVDLMLAFGALIHGHAHPRLVGALQRAAENGALTATASEIEVEVAERIAAMHPCAERVRFANTGTEACMAALRLVRGYTGRDKIIKFEGHYHGWADAYSLRSNLPDGGEVDSLGIPAGALADTIVLPWNDADAVEAALDAHRGEVAAIVTEPVMANMGVIPPADGYLQALRELADAHGALLFVDETVTGFRLGPGGACGRFGIRADVVTFGKALGAGFPVAALAGRADVLDALSGGRVLHYGTQNANPALLAVVNESLQLLDDAAYARLERLAERLVAGLRDALRGDAIVQSVGPMFQIYFTDAPAITSYRDFGEHVDRERFNRFVHGLFERGVYTSPSPALHSVLSTAHTDDDIDRVLAAV